jgi:molecular chaperone DnaK
LSTPNDDTELIIGIDLGTTESLVGLVDAGFPILLADKDGRRMTPSVVWFPPGDDPVVGQAAQAARVNAPGLTVSSVKRFLGRPFSSLSSRETQESSLDLIPLADDQIGIRLSDGRIVTPVQVSSVILGELKKKAEQILDEPVRRAVITVPAYFSHHQREATIQAAAAAGLEVARIINEPTAAALAYGLDRGDESRTVAVYDLGGGTFDLTVLRWQEGLFEVIATAGDTRLGGDDLDQLLAGHLRDQWQLPGLDLTDSTRLVACARKLKEALTFSEEATISWAPSDSPEIPFTVSRAKLEKLARPLLERTRPICQRALAEARGKGVTALDHLILVGGSTRMPLVSQLLAEWLGLTPQLVNNPDEAVAQGAVIQAGILCGRVRDLVLVDVTPLTLGIETFGGLMNAIIPRNTAIPAKAGELFTNAVSGQTSVAIRVLQGEREMARDNWLLGEVLVPLPPGPKGSARVGVQFSINQDGVLEVLARDTHTGADHPLTIHHAAVDVNDAAVEAMISSSVDHAFADMDERIWTEARLKSEEMLAAVTMALTTVGARLGDEERETIDRAIDLVKQILSSAEPDPTALRQANQKLDEATESLAVWLIEAAFE